MNDVSVILNKQQTSISDSLRIFANKVAANNPFEVNDTIFTNKSNDMDSLTISPAAVLKQKLNNISAQAAEQTEKQTLTETNPLIKDEHIDLMEKVTEMGKKHNKTLDVDDVTWGALVYLGESMGITDPAMLAKLETGDIFQFSNEFILKKQATLTTFVPDELLNKYASEADFWNAKFNKEAGQISRNENFKITMIDAARPDITTGFEESGSSLGKEKLYTLGASSLIMMAEGIKEKNYAKITWAYAQPNRIEPEMKEMEKSDLLYRHAYQFAEKNMFYTNSFKNDLTGEWLIQQIAGNMARNGANLSEADNNYSSNILFGEKFKSIFA